MNTRFLRLLPAIVAAPLLAGLFTVTSLPAAKTAKACACCGTYRVIGVEEGDMLNVRTGPGVGYQVKHQLPPSDGCILKTGKRHGRWVEITTYNAKGWVHRRYLGLIK